MSIVIQAVNRHLRLAVAADNRVGYITSLFDRDGDETEDANGAVSAVIKWSEHCWSAVDLRAFEPAGVH